MRNGITDKARYQLVCGKKKKKSEPHIPKKLKEV